MPKYTLTYFNARGLAELSRLMFAEKDVKYEDVRIQREEWPEFKKQTPLGQLPILKVDELVIPQSRAFARYLAREFGFYGSSSKDMARIDAVTETIDDLLQGLRTIMSESDEEMKAKKGKQFYSDEGQGPLGLGRLEKLLGDGELFVDNKMSLADFCMLIAGDWYMHGDKTAMDKFPKLTAHRKRVMERPNIAKWLKERPQTEF